MSNEEDDREMRQKSKDSDRFEGNTVNPDAALHSAEANTRMSPGNGKSGSGSRGDDDVTLDGYGPDDAFDDVSKEDEDGVMDLLEPDDDEDDGPALPSNNDVDQIAQDLLELDDEDTAQAVARIIIRTGDVVGDLAASMEDDDAWINGRMNPRAD